MANLVVKQHDTWPPIETVLEHTVKGEFVPIDLTEAASVKFIMKQGATSKSGTCTYPLPKLGNVIYVFQPTDTSSLGTYKVEWEIKWNNGGIESVPNEGYDTIEIVEDLA